MLTLTLTRTLTLTLTLTLQGAFRRAGRPQGRHGGGGLARTEQGGRPPDGPARGSQHSWHILLSSRQIFPRGIELNDNE